MLYFPSLSLIKYDVSKEWGVGVQKGPKYADVILEQPLKKISKIDTLICDTDTGPNTDDNKNNQFNDSNKISKIYNI